MDWWYYAFAISLGIAVAEAAVLIKQHLELRDLKAIALGLCERMEGNRSGGIDVDHGRLEMLAGKFRNGGVTYGGYRLLLFSPKEMQIYADLLSKFANEEDHTDAN